MNTHPYDLSQEPEALPFQVSFPSGGDTPSLEAELLYVSTLRPRPERQTASNAHAEILLVIGGSGEFHSGGQPLLLRENALLIVNPYVDHTLFSYPGDPLELLAVGIEGMEFTSCQEPGVVYIPSCQPLTGKYLWDLLEEARSTAYGHRSICQHLLAAVLISILRHRELGISVTATRDVQSFCAVVKAYIDTHYREAISLDTLAEVVQQNKFYLVHAFTKAYAMSPIKYLMRRKMEESKYLLADTDTSVAEIGAAVGFSSASHFTQAFKRIVGCTPNAYRKQVRSQAK